MLFRVAFGVLILSWIVWVLAFVRVRRVAAGQQKAVRAPASRWGIALVGIGYFLVWVQIHPVGFHKSAASLIVSMLLGLPSAGMAWAATYHLGKQWRYEAAISKGHELIQTGPYRFLRHPIYTSMFGMLLAAGCCVSWWPRFVAGVGGFLIGTEVRVRAEERLLAGHFPEYAEYRKRTSAYLPMIR